VVTSTIIDDFKNSKNNHFIAFKSKYSMDLKKGASILSTFIIHSVLSCYLGANLKKCRLVLELSEIFF
jgi:hypothetical protein